MNFRFPRFKHRLLFGLLGASLLAGSLSACGHPGNDTRWGMSEAESTQLREKMIERVARKLELDAPQKQLLGVLGDKLQAQRKALVGQGGDPRAEMQALLAGPRFERERAQALVNDKTEALRRQSPEVIAAFGDFYDSLRPEQQQKVRDFLQKRHGHRFGA